MTFGIRLADLQNMSPTTRTLYDYQCNFLHQAREKHSFNGRVAARFLSIGVALLTHAEAVAHATMVLYLKTRSIFLPVSRASIRKEVAAFSAAWRVSVLSFCGSVKQSILVPIVVRPAPNPVPEGRLSPPPQPIAEPVRMDGELQQAPHANLDAGILPLPAAPQQAAALVQQVVHPEAMAAIAAPIVPHLLLQGRREPNNPMEGLKEQLTARGDRRGEGSPSWIYRVPPPLEGGDLQWRVDRCQIGLYEVGICRFTTATYPTIEPFCLELELPGCGPLQLIATFDAFNGVAAADHVRHRLRDMIVAEMALLRGSTDNFEVLAAIERLCRRLNETFAEAYGSRPGEIRDVLGHPVIGHEAWVRMYFFLEGKVWAVQVIVGGINEVEQRDLTTRHAIRQLSRETEGRDLVLRSLGACRHVGHADICPDTKGSTQGYPVDVVAHTIVHTAREKSGYPVLSCCVVRSSSPRKVVEGALPDIQILSDLEDDPLGGRRSATGDNHSLPMRTPHDEHVGSARSDFSDFALVTGSRGEEGSEMPPPQVPFGLEDDSARTVSRFVMVTPERNGDSAESSDEKKGQEEKEMPLQAQTTHSARSSAGWDMVTPVPQNLPSEREDSPEKRLPDEVTAETFMLTPSTNRAPDITPRSMRAQSNLGARFLTRENGVYRRIQTEPEYGERVVFPAPIAALPVGTGAAPAPVGGKQVSARKRTPRVSATPRSKPSGSGKKDPPPTRPWR